MEVVGYRMEFNVRDVLAAPDKCSGLLAVLADGRFEFKCEFNTARAYLKTLTDRIQERRDDLIDLL